MAVAAQKLRKIRNAVVLVPTQPQDTREWNKGLEEYVFGKAMPANTGIEQAVLGALMLEKGAIEKISFLRVEDFYLEAHQLLYAAMLRLREIGWPIDILTVTEALVSTAHLAAVGNAAYLVELTNRVGSAANVEFHARVIAEKSLRRSAIEKACTLIRQCFDEGNDTFDLRNTFAEEMRCMPFDSYFKVQTMGETIAGALLKPEPKRMLGELLGQGEIAFCFAEPGAGKSIFACQAAAAITEGKGLFADLFPNHVAPGENGAGKKVLYFDIELKDTDLAKRYKDTDHEHTWYEFSPLFKRAGVNPNFMDFPDEHDFDRFIQNQIETAILHEKPDVIFVDNITALSAQAASDPQVGFRIMKFLKTINTRYGITIFVIGHTLKARAKNQALEMKDYNGSGAFQQFVDVIFGCARSAGDEDEIYLKQLKGRSSESGIAFGRNNVIKVRIEKQHGLLQYVYQGLGSEDDMLTSFMDATDQDDYVEAALRIKAARQMGWREITKEIGFPQSWQTLRNKAIAHNKKTRQYEFSEDGSTCWASGNQVPPPNFVPVNPAETPF